MRNDSALPYALLYIKILEANLYKAKQCLGVHWLKAKQNQKLYFPACQNASPA